MRQLFLCICLLCFGLGPANLVVMSCSSSECTNGYSQQEVSPSGRRCTKHCECNNQKFEGYCGTSGKCIAIEREACQAAKGSFDDCNVHPDLVALVSCQKGRRICQESGLSGAYWGNCRCTQQPKEPRPETAAEPQSEKEKPREHAEEAPTSPEKTENPKEEKLEEPGQERFEEAVRESQEVTNLDGGSTTKEEPPKEKAESFCESYKKACVKENCLPSCVTTGNGPITNGACNNAPSGYKLTWFNDCTFPVFLQAWSQKSIEKGHAWHSTPGGVLNPGEESSWEQCHVSGLYRIYARPQQCKYALPSHP